MGTDPNFADLPSILKLFTTIKNASKGKPMVGEFEFFRSFRGKRHAILGIRHKSS